MNCGVLLASFAALCSLQLPLTLAECPVANETQKLPNLVETGKIKSPYEINILAKVTKITDSGKTTETMSYVETAFNDVVDVTCNNAASGCIRQWNFNSTKQWLVLLSNNTECMVANYTAQNASVNVLIGGSVKLNQTKPSVTTGFMSLLESLAGLNSLVLNVSQNLTEFGVTKTTLYKMCTNFTHLNANDSEVNIFVAEEGDNPMVMLKRPYLVEVNLFNVDEGLFSNGMESKVFVNISQVFFVTYPNTTVLPKNDTIVPDSVYCNWPTNLKNITWPDAENMSFAIEEFVDQDKYSVIRHESFCKPEKLHWRSFMTPTSDFKDKLIYKNYFDSWLVSDYSGENKRFHVLHDFTDGIEWRVGPDDQTCQMRKIPLNSPDAVSNTSNVTMNSAFNQLFFRNFSEMNFQYYGESMFKSIPVSVFGAQSFDNNTDEISVYKVFMVSNDWKFDSEATITNPVVGIKIFITNNKTKTPVANYQASLMEYGYNKLNLTEQFYKSADFSVCASKSPVYTVAFNDTSKLVCDSGKDISTFESQFGNILANASKVSRLRVGSVSISCINSTALVFFRVVDRLNNTVTHGNVNDSKYIATMKEAIENLNRTVVNNTFSLPLAGGKFLYAVNTSLRLSNETGGFNVSNVIYVHTSDGAGYSSGSMALLAFIMLAVGAAAAMFGVYCYQRRRRNQFSYMVQE